MVDGLHTRPGISSALISVVASGVALATVSQASPASDNLGRAVRAEIGSPGSFFTPDERRVIADRCVEPGLDPAMHNISIENDVVVCPDGRRVRDPAVKALAERVGQRAGARAEAAMRSARVQAAMAGVQAEALRHAAAELNR